MERSSRILVLSRQRDESIMVGDTVEIIIVDVRGDKVRLGVTAPKNIPVHRKEIYDAIQRDVGKIIDTIGKDNLKNMGSKKATATLMKQAKYKEVVRCILMKAFEIGQSKAAALIECSP